MKEAGVTQLIGAILAADELRALHLADAAEEENEKQELLAREIDRLSRKPGIAPERIESLKRKLAVHRAASGALLAEVQRARVATPPAGADRAALHGRVVDPAGAGLKGLTVRVAKAGGEQWTSAETSDTGYFRFVLPSREALQVQMQVRSAKNILLAEEKSIALTPGETVYREIVIEPAAEPPIRPPRPPVR